MKLVNFLSKYYLLFCFIISCLIASTIYYQFLQALNTDLDALSWSITQASPKATATGCIGAVERIKEVITAEVYAYNSEIGQTDADPNIMANLTKEEQAVIWCESRNNPLAENPSSTAKGLAQFTDTTWKNYCFGDVFNVRDNINCFKKLYPLHKNWWSECLDK